MTSEFIKELKLAYQKMMEAIKKIEEKNKKDDKEKVVFT